MKKVLVLILSFFCMLSFVSCEKENKPDSFESNMHRMYGDYKLSDIHWPGLPVDLNNDGIGYWDLLYEFKNKIGYYEPDYIAMVNDGTVYSYKESYAEYATAFNVAIPYPYFIEDEGEWKCTSIRTIQLTLRSTEKTFEFRTNCSFIYPGFNDPDDLFLANVKDISLVVDSFEEKVFQIGVHCSLPTPPNGGGQTINENYLYYEYTKQ